MMFCLYYSHGKDKGGNDGLAVVDQNRNQRDTHSSFLCLHNTIHSHS